MNRQAGSWASLLLTILAAAACGRAAPPPDDGAASGPKELSPGSDPQAVEIANAVLKRMGGKESWDATRYVRWRFMGRRLHHWDRASGDIRIESPAREDRPERLVLMNIETKKGRVWDGGQEVTDPQKLQEALEDGHEWWVNDSYWMFMPYKLLDPGVTLKYVDKRPLPDGRAADVLELTFGDGVGYTPENRYEVYVARDTGLVEQWSYWEKAADVEPKFTMPWGGWKPFGRIWLATEHGMDADWQIAVLDDLPPSVFHEPGPAAG